MVRQAFSNRYRVTIPERSAWENNQRPYDVKWELIVYTDGSRKNGLTGAGWINAVDEASFAVLRLGGQATVFQAEVYAIENCATKLVHQKIKGRSIAICSDSQAALKALDSTTVSTVLVGRCRDRLNALVEMGNAVRLIWCPGHSGIQGNERADQLANQGSDLDRTRKDPTTPVALATFRTAVRKWIADEWEKKWQDPAIGCRQSKEFLGMEPPYKKSKDLINCSRQDARHLTGILTGHINLNGHLETIGVIDSAMCSFCQQERESSKHICANAQQWCNGA